MDKQIDRVLVGYRGGKDFKYFDPELWESNKDSICKMHNVHINIYYSDGSFKQQKTEIKKYTYREKVLNVFQSIKLFFKMTGHYLKENWDEYKDYISNYKLYRRQWQMSK